MITQDQLVSAERSPQLIAQLAAFRSDPPIRASFPITMNNGAVVPAFAAHCGNCGQPIDPDWVRGRMFDSLPTVKTMDANAYCVRCAQFFHYDVRFRTVADFLQVEVANKAGRWSIIRTQPASPMKKLARRGLQLLTKGWAAVRNLH